MKTLILTLSMLVSGSYALATDHWDRCESQDQKVVVDEGRLFDGGQDISDFANMKVIKKVALGKRTETCKLKKSGRTVVSLSEEITQETIRWGYKMNTLEAVVICKRGGSGIPASDSCSF